MCGRLSNLTAEILVTLTYWGWVLSFFCIGHLFSIPIYNCKAGWSECTFVEPIGILCAFVASVSYLHIARHVLNVLYKKELPGGADFVKEFGGVFDQIQKNGKKAKKR
jgi:hypothetical protein